MASTPRRANYALSVTKAMLTFAVKRGLRPNNPAVGIALYRENRRERFLSEAEIGAAADGITAAEKSGKIGPFAAAGLRLALLPAPVLGGDRLRLDGVKSTGAAG